MAKLNYYLDCRTSKADGTSPLKVVVNTNQGNFQISLGIFLQPSQWDTRSRVVVKHPRRVFLNSHLSDQLLQAEQIMLSEKKKQGHALTKVELKNVLVPLFQNKTEGGASLLTVFNQFITDNRKKTRTQELYATTLAKL